MDYFVSIYAYAHKDICESVKCFIKLNGIFALFSKYMSEIWHHVNVFWTSVADSKIKKKIVRENEWQ